MTIPPGASPQLYNEDLAPAKERNWGAFSIFNVWTSDVHSLWGYYLAASLFLLCGSFVNFLIAIGIGSLIIYLPDEHGGQLPACGPAYPSPCSPAHPSASGAPIFRRSFAPSSPASGTARRRPRLRAPSSPCSIRNEGMLAFHQNSQVLEPFDAGGHLLRRRLGAAAADHPARHGNGAPVPGLGRSGSLDHDAVAGHLPGRQGRRLLARPHDIPMDVLLEKTKEAGVPGVPGSFAALMAVAARSG